MRRTLVAFFDDAAAARGAAKDLLDVGLSRGDVRLLGADDAGDPALLGLSGSEAERLAERLRRGDSAVLATAHADGIAGVREILGRDGSVEMQGGSAVA